MSLLVTEKLNTRFLARLKSMSLLRKGDQERMALSGSQAAVKGGTVTAPLESWGPTRKPAYLDSW